MQNFEIRTITDYPDLLEAFFEGRKEGVAARNFAFDEGEVKVGTLRQRLFVNLRAAANEDLARFVRQIKPAQI